MSRDRSRWFVVFGALIALAVVSSACRPEQVWQEDDVQQWVTIYDIQEQHPDDADPALGSRVALRSVVVTAYDSNAELRFDRVERGSEFVCVEEVGYTGGIVVQEIGGGPWSGVSLFNPTLVPAYQQLGPGDLVDIRGRYLEFCYREGAGDSFCDAANIDRLTQLGDATASKVGEVAPLEPIDVSLQTLSQPNTAEPYEGVLVRISGRFDIAPCTNPAVNCCSGDYDAYGNLCIGERDDRNRCQGFEITNEFYSVPEGTRCLSSVTGIVAWFFDYRLSPRSRDDVVIPEECRPRGGE